MENLQLIDLTEDQLAGLPLFFRKIYFNRITDMNVDNKLMKHNDLIQCDLFRDSLSLRRISKTVDYTRLNLEDNE